jgi:hypothetical protein
MYRPFAKRASLNKDSHSFGRVYVVAMLLARAAQTLLILNTVVGLVAKISLKS